jgi:hypothetical protein
MWHTNDVLLDIGSLKKSQLQAVLFIKRPDTAGAPLLVRRLLLKFAGSRMASSIIKGTSCP